MHVILGFKPISTHFQFPKHVIKAKDLRLALIDVAVPGFLNKPPPSGTQDFQLPTPLAAKLLYFHEQPLPFDDEREEPSREPTQKVQDKDFEVFYQEDPKDSPTPAYRHLVVAQVSTSQEVADILKAMVLKEKMPNLLVLLTAHARGDALVVPIVP